ncbi:MAG: alpha/beta fold hydrolase, partial [Gammaproteobacteria bacterium]
MPGLGKRCGTKLGVLVRGAVLSLWTTAGMPSSDFQYEQQRSDTVARSVTEGKVVWLQAGQLSFLSVFLEAERPETRRAVVILPGISDHADSNGLVRSLRTSFPAHGWNSLSLQMPLRYPDQDLENYLSLVPGSGIRVRAATDYLASEKIKNVVLIGHDLGAWMAVDYLSDPDRAAVTAVVFVSMPVFRDNRLFDPLVATLKDLKIPVLDIFGGRDLDSVINTRDLRRQWFKKNRSYRQVEISGAGHDFDHDC